MAWPGACAHKDLHVCVKRQYHPSPVAVRALPSQRLLPRHLPVATTAKRQHTMQAMGTQAGEYEGLLGSPRLQQFLDSEDLSLLDKPLLFQRHAGFGKYLGCVGACMGVFSYGISTVMCPIGTFCNHTLADQHSLQLDRDVVRFNSARNDLCCHIATTSKAVPLDKIQDVELNKNAILTCFGLKSLNIQTAGQGGGPMPEVSATFLQNPEQVRDAIQLAAKLAKQQAAGAPQQAAGMSRSNNAASSSGAGTLLSRLQRLKGLVDHQVLTEAEADAIQAQVLGAESDPLARLVEAAQLMDLKQLSAQEFEAVKAVILRRLMAASS